MQSLSKISTTPIKNAERNAEETHHKQKMTDGYPVTMSPFVPEIMKHAIVQKNITSIGRPCLGLTFSSETKNLVSIECLEKIRKKLLEIYAEYPEVVKELEKSIPSNTIAVSFVQRNFQLGKSCQDFSPLNKFKIPKDATFTYQKLSKNLQATIYNESGTQFLAGLCYYPEPYGKQSYLKNDDALILLKRAAAEPYPLQDREKKYQNVNYNRYGRDCGTAGKRVLVDCSGKYGVIRHIEYNHFSNKWAYQPCDECLKDAFTYKWEEPKEEEPEPNVTSTYSEPTEKASDTSTLPSGHQQQDKLPDLLGILQVLEMVISMIHKISKEVLPVSKSPQLKDLTTFLKSNPDWCINFSSLKEVAGNWTGAESESSGSLEAQKNFIRSKSDDIQKNPSDSPKPSNTAAQASELPTVLPEKKQEAEQLNLIPVIKLLNLFGIPTRELSMLNSMPIDTKIPIINKITKKAHPESERPQFKDLTTFLESNPDLCIDFPSLKEGTENKSKDSGVTIVMDSPIISSATKSSDSPTFSAFSETPSTASSTENLLEDFDKVDDATERDNEFDAEMVN